VPDHGTWGEQAKIPGNLRERRIEMRTRYANRPEDPEAIPPIAAGEVVFQPPERAAPRATQSQSVQCEGWPFSQEQALSRRAAVGLPLKKTLDLGDGVIMEFALVPAGSFVLGDSGGCPDEQPRQPVRIAKPFYIGATEVTCAQYGRFDSDHFNGFHDQRHKDHTLPGYPAHADEKPVIRVSWLDAMAFCDWLASRTGQACTLPTEAEWEWACRAGADSPFWYGDRDVDFSTLANLADSSTRLLAVTGVNPSPIPNPNRFQDYLPKDARFNDNERLMAPVGQYRPNAWELYDMHGNVWEWTRSNYASYPYATDDGRNVLSPDHDKVVRGGSWRDRPERARAGYRLAYKAFQPVFNVGFRVAFTAEEVEVSVK
jgi:formylglycine-generating enzyme required for sulfatase activity